MGIANYIKTIGRGSQGARAISRDEAADLWGQLLDGTVTDLEVGAFCLAMRIKGETPQEMAGFLDATHARIRRLPMGAAPTVIIPSYNGARKLPVLTPLLAILLAREGLRVLMHGTATESGRVSASDVLLALDIPALSAIESIADGTVAFSPTALLHPGLERLLDVRRTVGVRNSAHSLVKLMIPAHGPTLLVTSYTHPEYAVSMADTLALTTTDALLLRGTEGEAVADPRRTPRMQAVQMGQVTEVQEAQAGSLASLPELPADIGVDSTAAYIRAVLDGQMPLPQPIARQVAHIIRLARSL